MSGQRGKFLQKSLRFLQRLLVRLCHSFVALLIAPLLLLQKMGRKKKSSTGNSLRSRRPHFSLKLFKNQRRAANSGFVLPTIAILLLIMSLVVSSLLFRTINRTTQVIGQRNQQVIYNAATPAIDRAKAKLEYLFSANEERRPPLPSDSDLENILKNTSSQVVAQNPYDLPDETRLDITENGINAADNAWVFYLDTNGDWIDTNGNGRLDANDENVETVAYSILIKTDDPGPNGAFEPATATTTDDIDRTNSDAAKSARLVVRNGPVNLISREKPECQSVYSAPEAGWDSTTSSATVRRAFQVMAVVIDGDNQASRTVATLEMQQDREADRGNKWGAWFRNDLELFPGPGFRWNGAMHTEGNLMIGDSDNFEAFLISSPSSCLYTRSNSEITIGGRLNESTPPYLGQMMAATMKENKYHGSSKIDLFKNTPPIPRVTINRDSDSVTPNTETGTPRPADISLDPVALFTSNQNQTRSSPPDLANTAARINTWKTSQVVTQGRIINTSAAAPYVDDTYRADNRYGPKPQYNDRIGLPTGKKVGEAIASTDTDYVLLTKLDATATTTSSTEENSKETQGLDGYWERRAWAEGLRVIVGQRLEMGNAFGWQEAKDLNSDGDYNDLNETDPLYPPTGNAANDSSMSDRKNEQRQWKTLRDNLAAVQATAIYHQANPTPSGTTTADLEAKRNFPIACLATTAHPGTQTTIINSTTFSVDSGGVPTNINFLTGNGTNGWEFNPPASSETAFINATDSATDPLRIALKNLAYFAGDPYGAFRLRQDTEDSNSANDVVPSFGQAVHPYPFLSMWGDFSNLRQVIAQLDGGTTYANLSLADKTTLHTAACTLGMLAHRLDIEIQAYRAALVSSSLQSAGVKISSLVDGNNSSGGGNSNKEIENVVFGNSYDKYTNWTDPNTATVIPNPDPATQGSNPYICTPYDSTKSLTDPWNLKADKAGYQDNCDAPEFYSQFTKDQWLDAAGITGADRTTIDLVATTIARGNQILRDRALGFRPGNPPAAPGTPNGVFWNPDTGLTGVEQVGGNDVAVKTGCDPDIFYGVTASGVGGGSNDRAKIGLSLTFCSSNLSVKYPSLYYLFPLFNHDHDGNNDSSNTNIGFNHTQPSSEPYVSDRYIFNTSATDEANHNYEYKVVQDGIGTRTGVEDSTENGPSAVAIQPKALSSWSLPSTTITSGRANIIKRQGTTDIAVPFLDKGIFNGREMMGVRVLDVDLDMLRRDTAPGKTIGGETWLPNSGIVFAFREDALREDGIARPIRSASGSVIAWASCDTATEITSNNCRIDATGNNPNDAPVNSTTGISAKPVDFYADPDRRPHGFRLRNGAYLRHPVSNPVLRGLAFISDNPVYIMADQCAFNLHSSAENSTPSCSNLDTNRIEEFTNLLDDDWGDFYTRGSTNADTDKLNQTFGRAGDTWRPAEIIADAVSVLSSNFVDGSIAEGIRRENVGSNNSSYRTLNAPDEADRSWVREDGSVSNEVNAAVPIKISRNGFPLYCVNAAGIDSGILLNPSSCQGTLYREQPYGRENDALPSGFITKPNSGTKRTYMSFGNDKALRTTPDNTRVNATMVSGLVPSRGGQSYGGFHNFPRFLENWNDKNLHISGAFIQLNFSASATAPFDQDSWEPGASTAANIENIKYYSPPNRRWGYDVGLQYAPAGPVARRFLTPSNTRSEFYRELPLDDPYICRLRRAKKQVSGGGWTSAGIDPQAPSSCPSS